MRQILSITRKELESYFGSPMALIFVGVFLVVTLFAFFWVDTFFARGIADVRPLFQWMPVLLIFLIAALTMRQWSEEQQTGTLEVLLTLPVRLSQLVLGKFLAVLVLVAVALMLTLSLPITVTIVGNPDPGPIIGGYLAALLMASAYIAIGLFVSSRTDNQIVSLIMTVILCGLFYMVGAPAITGLFNYSLAEFLRALGTGSRFQSIERGVIDLRDLVYYVTLTLVFLGLNMLSLESKRWGQGKKAENYRLNRRLALALVIANLVLFNVLLLPLNTARADLTENGEYTLSSVTRELLSNLQEPLLIRGYFSEDNHPLLAPLIPRIRDTLEEYRIAADGKLELEFIDPITDPDVELEANQTYGIRPSPLQVSGRSGTSVINAYFDILIRYGDQTATLNLLQDLIEVTDLGGSLDVQLRNLEYDLTSSIQRVVYGFQSIDSVLASLENPATLTLYVTPDTLPEAFAGTPDTVASVAGEIAAQSNGKFTFETVDMSAPDAPVTRDFLFTEYQIRPIATSFFSADTFYLHLVLQAGDQPQVIYPSGEMSETEIRTAIESALKRVSSGFLKVVGIWTPPSTPQTDMFGQQVPSLQQYTTIADLLRESYEVRNVDLTSGQVPADLDTLVVIGAQNMTDKERYAVDQYLMRGGAVLIAAGSQQLVFNPDGTLGLQPIANGLKDVLAHYGITVEDSVVMDTQNAPFPVQTARNIGGMVVNEIQAINYPFFVDVRQNAMDRSNPALSNVPGLLMSWVSPITVNTEQNAERTVSVLLKSSGNSWTTTNTNIQPDLQLYPDQGFPVGSTQQSYTLAVAVEGSFGSYFVDKPSPFVEAPAEDSTAPEAPATETPAEPVTSFIESSPDTARLVVIGSSEFLNDNIVRVAQSVSGDLILNNFQFVQNAVDWFVEDTALSSIRAGGSAARVLNPLTESEQSTWEAVNYAFAIISLIVLGFVWRAYKRSEKPMELTPVPAAGDSTLTPATQIEG